MRGAAPSADRFIARNAERALGRAADAVAAAPASPRQSRVPACRARLQKE